MITTNAKEFEGEEFAMQIIARGGFTDCGTGDGAKYYVDTINLRANHIMSKEYSDGNFSFLNTLWEDCCETKEEWENEKQQSAKQRKIWEKKVKDNLKTVIPNIYDGSCLIIKVHSEIFSVMHVYKIECFIGEQQRDLEERECVE